MVYLALALNKPGKYCYFIVSICNIKYEIIEISLTMGCYEEQGIIDCGNTGIYGF
jgi:hypothetical protein